VERRENWDWRDPDPAAAPLMAPLVGTRCLSQRVSHLVVLAAAETFPTVGRRRKLVAW
jgi:hypothetical protein